MTMRAGRNPEDKFLLVIIAMLFTLFLFYSTCGRTDSHEQMKEAIRKEAIRQGVNPDIAVAIATVESNLNSHALGKNGDIGLFQIMPYHAKGRNLWVVKNNIRIGISIMRSCQESSRSTPASIVCFNNGRSRHPKYPQLHPYYRKVMAAVEQL